MDQEVRRYLAFALVGIIAASVTTSVDIAMRNNTSAAKTPLLIALILFLVFAVGYMGTYIVEWFGTNIQEAGGRLKVLTKGLYIYLLTWFVIYVLMYNVFVYKG